MMYREIRKYSCFLFKFNFHDPARPKDANDIKYCWSSLKPIYVHNMFLSDKVSQTFSFKMLTVRRIRRSFFVHDIGFVHNTGA